MHISLVTEAYAVLQFTERWYSTEHMHNMNNMGNDGVTLMTSDDLSDKKKAKR